MGRVPNNLAAVSPFIPCYRFFNIKNCMKERYTFEHLIRKSGLPSGRLESIQWTAVLDWAKALSPRHLMSGAQSMTIWVFLNQRQRWCQSFWRTLGKSFAYARLGSVTVAWESAPFRPPNGCGRSAGQVAQRHRQVARATHPGSGRGRSRMFSFGYVCRFGEIVRLRSLGLGYGCLGISNIPLAERLWSFRWAGCPCYPYRVGAGPIFRLLLSGDGLYAWRR